jgi:protein-tyrosine phosphatase
MKTQVLKIDPENIDLNKIRKAANLVDTGQLVAFPTETVYGIACRIKNDSLALLDRLKSRPAGKPYTLHIGRLKDMQKYVPSTNLKAQKLIERCWPGPLTIIFELDENDILRQSKKIKPEVFDNLYRNNSIGIRFPDNPIASTLLQHIENPVIAPSANITGRKPATEAQQVLSSFSGQIPLILDGGPCKYKTSSTVVKIGKNNLQVLREGVFSKAEIEKIATVYFLFVCTGNSCRSPMAEGFFKRYLAEKLNCPVDRLEEKGYKVSSAGTMGVSGLTASSEAITACAAMGIDITKHRSIALSKELIENADIIFVMSNAHLTEVLELLPQAKDKCLLLAKQMEIADPIGQEQKVYFDSAQLIQNAVKERIEELKI